MKYTITFLSLFIINLASAQNFIDRHFDTYQDRDDATIVHVAPKSFDIASYLIPEHTEESAKAKELVSSITSLDVVAVEDYPEALTEYKRGYSILENGFESLVDIKDKGSRIGFFIDQEDDIIYEVVGIGAVDGSFFLVSITGEMRLEMISSIINEIQEKGHFEQLAPLKEYDTTAFEIYPNPSSSNSQINVDIPESMMGGDVTIYDYTGKQVFTSLGVQDSPHIISTEGLNPGTFVVSLEHNDVQLKKKVVVVR